MFYVYVLKNKDGLLYIGQTKDLEDRLLRHNSGREKATKSHGPYVLIHKECYDNRSEAMIRERQLKMGQGRLWIKDNFCK